MKKLAVTMGDPAGIGPDLCLKLANSRLPVDVEVVIYGNAQHLERVRRHSGITGNEIKIKDHPISGLASLRPGEVQAVGGRAAYTFLSSAIEDALAGRVDGIVTCPLNKASLELAGVHYPGHTEILVAQTGASKHAMMLTGGDLSCSLVTTHIPLAKVSESLSVERIYEVSKLTAELMRKKHGRGARLGMLGLNPHAGEGGLFGKEEEEVIFPAVYQLRAAGIEVTAPLPPDTAFLPHVRKMVDAYVCMYHDQGLIPLKTLYFEVGVNVTLGLPIIRTSVDHGTAFDLAWTGKAEEKSLLAAVEYAVSLVS